MHILVDRALIEATSLPEGSSGVMTHYSNCPNHYPVLPGKDLLFHILCFKRQEGL